MFTLPYASKIRPRLSLARRILPLVVLVTLLKVPLHSFGYEPLEFGGFLNSLVAGDIFLLSFLLNNILQEYKEGERLNGAAAASIEAIADELRLVVKYLHSPVALEAYRFLAGVPQTIKAWYYEQERTRELMRKVAKLNSYFEELRCVLPIQVITHLKREQTALRATMVRIHTIRETSFIVSAYAIAEFMTVFIVAALLLARIPSLFEAVFYVFGASFLMFYVITLVRDLDHPFNYKKSKHYVENVTLRPLNDLEQRLQDLLARMESGYCVVPVPAPLSETPPAMQPIPVEAERDE